MCYPSFRDTVDITNLFVCLLAELSVGTTALTANLLLAPFGLEEIGNFDFGLSTGDETGDFALS